MKNRGVVFITGFRWVLLLLSALMFEKMADGICYKITGQTLFESLRVVWPLAAMPSEYSVDGIEWRYFSGVLQFLSAVMLLARYFTCLIDPIWRSAKIDINTDFSNGSWLDKLSTVSAQTIASVTFISLVEFLLFYHSSISIPDVNQWLNFLLFLVLADFSYFLIPSLISSIKQLPKFLRVVITDILLIILRVIWAVLLAIVHLILAGIKKIAKDQHQNNKTLSIDDHINSIQSERDKLYYNVKVELASIWKAYGPWDLLDLSSVVWALWFYNYFSHNEFLTCLFFACLTAGISYANFYVNRKVYYVHITILRLKQA